MFPSQNELLSSIFGQIFPSLEPKESSPVITAGIEPFNDKILSVNPCSPAPPNLFFDFMPPEWLDQNPGAHPSIFQPGVDKNSPLWCSCGAAASLKKNFGAIGTNNSQNFYFPAWPLGNLIAKIHQNKGKAGGE